MQKSNAKTLSRVLLAIGLIFGLISRFFLADGPFKITLHNIAFGIILGSFIFTLMIQVMPRWFRDDPGSDMNKV
jgi:hypothetical protein